MTKGGVLALFVVSALLAARGVVEAVPSPAVIEFLKCPDNTYTAANCAAVTGEPSFDPEVDKYFTLKVSGLSTSAKGKYAVTSVFSLVSGGVDTMAMYPFTASPDEEVALTGGEIKFKLLLSAPIKGRLQFKIKTYTLPTFGSGYVENTNVNKVMTLLPYLQPNADEVLATGMTDPFRFSGAVLELRKCPDNTYTAASCTLVTSEGALDPKVDKYFTLKLSGLSTTALGKYDVASVFSLVSGGVDTMAMYPFTAQRVDLASGEMLFKLLLSATITGRMQFKIKPYTLPTSGYQENQLGDEVMMLLPYLEPAARKVLATGMTSVALRFESDCPTTDVKLHPHELNVDLLSVNASTGFQFAASIPIWVETEDGNDVSFEAEATVMATIDGKPFQAYRNVEYYIVPKVSQVTLDREVPEGTKPMPRTFLNFTFSVPPGCNLDDAFTVAIRVDRGNSVQESDESNNAFWTTIAISSLVPTVISVIPDLKGKFIYNVNVPNKLFVTTDAPLLPGMRLEYSTGGASDTFKTDNNLPPDGFTTVPTKVYKLGTQTYYEYALDLSMGLFSPPDTGSSSTGTVWVWLALPVAVYTSTSEATKGTSTGIIDLAASSSSVYNFPALVYKMANGGITATSTAMANRTHIAKLQVRVLTFDMIVSPDVVRLVNIASGAAAFSADNSGNSVADAAASVGRLRDPLIPASLWRRSSLNPQVRPSFYRLSANIKPNATGIVASLDTAFDSDTWFGGDYGAAIDLSITWTFDSSSGKLWDSVEAYFWILIKGSTAIKIPVTKVSPASLGLGLVATKPEVWPAKVWNLPAGPGTADTLTLTFAKATDITIPMSKNVLLSNGLVVPVSYSLVIKAFSLSIAFLHLKTSNDATVESPTNPDSFITILPGLFYAKKATPFVLGLSGAVRINGMPEAGGVMAAIDAFSDPLKAQDPSSTSMDDQKDEKFELTLPFSPSKPFISKAELVYDFNMRLVPATIVRPTPYAEVCLSVPLPDMYKPKASGTAGSYFLSGTDGKLKSYSYTLPTNANDAFAADPVGYLAKWAAKELNHDKAVGPFPDGAPVATTEYFKFDAANDLESKLKSASDNFPFYSYGGGSGALLRNTFERYPGAVAMALEGRAKDTKNPRLFFLFGFMTQGGEQAVATAHYLQPLPKAAVPGKPDNGGPLARSWMADFQPSVAWLPTTEKAAALADSANYAFEAERVMAISSHDNTLAGLHSITAVTRILSTSDTGWVNSRAGENVFSSSYLTAADVVVSHGMTALSSAATGEASSKDESLASGITALNRPTVVDSGVGVVISNSPESVTSAAAAAAVGDLPDTCPIGGTTTGPTDIQFKPNGFDGFPSVAAAPYGSGLVDVLVNVINDDEYADTADAGHILPFPSKAGSQQVKVEFFQATSIGTGVQLPTLPARPQDGIVDDPSNKVYDLPDAIKRVDGMTWRWTPVGPDPKDPTKRADLKNPNTGSGREVEIEEEIVGKKTLDGVNVALGPSGPFDDNTYSYYNCTVDFKTRIVIPFKGGLVKLSRASTLKINWVVPPSHYRVQYLISTSSTADGATTTQKWDRFDDNSFVHQRTYKSFRELTAINSNCFCPNDNVATTTYPAIKARNDTFVATVDDGDTYRKVKGVVIVIESGYPGTGSNPAQGRLNQRVELESVSLQHTATLPNFVGSLIYVKDGDSRIAGKNHWNDHKLFHSTFMPSVDFSTMMTTMARRRWSAPVQVTPTFAVPNVGPVNLNAAERIQSHTTITNPVTGAATTFFLVTSAIPAAADALGSHVLQVFGMAYFHATDKWTRTVLISTMDNATMTSSSCRAAVMQPAMASDFDSSFNLSSGGLVYHVGFICDKPSKTMSSSQVGFAMVVVDVAAGTIAPMASSFKLFDERYCMGASTLTLAKTDFGLSALWVIGRALIVSEIRLPLKAPNGFPRSAVVFSGNDWTVPARAALPDKTTDNDGFNQGRIPVIYASQAMKSSTTDTFAPIVPIRALTVRFPLAHAAADGNGNSQWRITVLRPTLKISDIGFVGLAPQMTGATNDATSDVSSATAGAGIIQVLVQVNNTGFIRSTGGKLTLNPSAGGSDFDLASVSLSDIPANTAQTIVVPVRVADIMKKATTFVYAVLTDGAGSADPVTDSTTHMLVFQQAPFKVDASVKKSAGNPCLLSLGGLAAHPLTGISATLTHLGACVGKVTLEVDFEKDNAFVQAASSDTVDVYVPPGSSGAVAFDEDLSAVSLKAALTKFVNEGTGTTATSSRGLLLRVKNRDSRDLALTNDDDDAGAVADAGTASRKAHFGPNSMAPTALVIPFIPRQLYIPADGVRVTHNYDLVKAANRYTVVAVTVMQLGVAPVTRDVVKGAIKIDVEWYDETPGSTSVTTTATHFETVCYDPAGRLLDKDYATSRTTSTVLKGYFDKQYPGMRCVYKFRLTSSDTDTDLFTEVANMYRITAYLDNTGSLNNLEFPKLANRNSRVPAMASIGTEASSLMVGVPVPSISFKAKAPDDTSSA